MITNKLNLFLVLIPLVSFTQNIQQKLDEATREFLASPGMLSASMSFYVTNEKGDQLFDYQGNKGLSTASTQKIFTAISALDLLGENYFFETKLHKNGSIENHTLLGDLVFHSTGDPTLGSWRYPNHQAEKFKQKILETLQNLKIRRIEGDLVVDDSYFDFQNVPGGWAWNDIGNYYGAGVWGVNWRENQFDIHFQGGKNENELATIQDFSYPIYHLKWASDVKSHKGKGDKSILYTAPHSSVAYANGSLPMNEITKVSGALPNPPMQLALELKEFLAKNGIQIQGKATVTSTERLENPNYSVPQGEVIMIHQSPKLSEILFWFMKKSVNLYGETLIKTIGKTKNGDSSYSNGIQILRSFWQEKGIHPAMINFMDGSGLSPQNYASAKAEVEALLWAKNQPWFSTFQKSFPVYNRMTMKSGTIKDTKAYAGYHTSSQGKKYIFSVIVNNYHGKDLNAKLFQLLDILK